jgi:cyclase
MIAEGEGKGTRSIRICPRLDIKGLNVVKGVHMEGLRVVGDPVDLALKYYQDGADEIIYLDIVASLYQREFDFELLKRVAKEVFVPITAGGGLRTVDDIKKALASGADKVAINTAGIKKPAFLQEAVEVFGGQCIVLYIEAKRIGEASWEAYIDGGRERTNVDVLGWVRTAQELGVGEVLLSSIDADGTRLGYDIELVKKIAPEVSVPLIVHGGGWTSQMVLELLRSANVDMVAASSMFHYNHHTIPDLKKELSGNGINVRLT